MFLKIPTALFCLFLLVLLQIPEKLYAQHFTDSLQIYVGSHFTIASRDYQPLWLVANRYGTISDQKMDVSSHFGFSNKHVFGNSSSSFQNRLQGFSRSSLSDKKEQGGYVKYGLNLYNNQHFQDFFIEEAYIKAGYHHWELRGGRYEELIGETDTELSSGSLGISGNALPIPKVGVAVTDYMDVPFTQGWLQFKGLFNHGWMGKERMLKEAFLHEKTFYMRLNTGRLKLFGGIQHFAVWGGKVSNFKLDRDWKGFMDVMLVREADDGSVNNPDKLPNRAGDHRGVIEGGFQYDGDLLQYKFYHQTPFETGQGITFRNIDKLAGFSVIAKDTRTVFQRVLLEFLYTKQMNNFYVISSRESYYNNGVYKTGWEYLYRVIGTPLFVNLERGSRYFDDIQPVDWQSTHTLNGIADNIINNRVMALHFGVKLRWSKLMSSKSLLTFSRNYGTYNRTPFQPYKDQWYFLQAIYLQITDNIQMNLEIGLDAGVISRNVGSMAGFTWHIH